MFKKIKEDTTHIPALEELISEKLKVKVIQHEVRPLNEFGENFGSEMLKVELAVEENGEKKTLHAIAKLIPHTEFQLKIFNTQVSFKNEIGFYAEIVPAIRAFQQEYNVPPVDYFAEMYGARINLKHGSDIVDTDAVIIMENLKTAGFENIDRRKGFDLHSAKTILGILANFQATVLALRKNKPDVFSSKILPYLHDWDSGKPDIDIETILSENPHTVPLIPKVKRLLAKRRFKKIREPWATITHNDLWVNNIMIKHTDEDISAVKFVDFQTHDYGSPAADVIFFLLSSVQIPVLRYHFEKLLQHYLTEFTNTLVQFKVNIKDYTYISFKDELKAESAYQIHHALFMTFVVMGPKGVQKPPGKVAPWKPTEHTQEPAAIGHLGPPPTEMSEEDQPPKGPGDTGNSKPPSMPKFRVEPNLKERVWFIIEEAARQKWI